MKKISQLALGCLLLPPATAFAEKPNIILIMTDQQSYNMISALSDSYPTLKNYSSTPNLDRLVRNGISFTNVYCANPVSLPSRFALFTGMYGGQYNVTNNLCPDAKQNEILSMLKTNAMGNVFQHNGYDTYYGGKVHLPYANGKSKFDAPVNYGFSNYLTTDERAELGKIGAEFIKNRRPGKPFLLVASFLNPHDICLESSTNLSKTPKVDKRKPEISETIQKMRNKAASYDSTYFYNHLVPDLPYNFAKTVDFPANFRPRSFHDFPVYYWKKYRWIYSQLTSLVDSHIGMILDAIDASPLKNNTIIIFTSDHGEMQGAHHASEKNLPLEECQRVPFIICGKGIVKNQRDNSLICNGIDLMPTLCELAGIPLPANLKGISVAGRATKNEPVSQRKYLYLEGDRFRQMIENDQFKYTLFDIPGSPDMLIDLKNDPGERINISAGNAKDRKKSEELNSILEKQR